MKKRINFSKEPLGLYTDEQVKKNFGNSKIVTTSVRPEIVRDGKKKVLCLPFKKGKFGKEDKASWHMDLGKDYETIYCQYKIKFSKGFDWALGGKLPGFRGGERAKKAGIHPDKGFSSRIMWREKGEMHQYAYYPGDSSNWGRGFWWHNLNSKKMERLRFKPGKWHTIKMKIKMNNGWRDPGHFICWLDGKLAMYQDIKLRTKIDAKKKLFGIRHLMFTVFFGGNDERFAPKRNSSVYFDKFIISDKDFT